VSYGERFCAVTTFPASGLSCSSRFRLADLASDIRGQVPSTAAGRAGAEDGEMTGVDGKAVLVGNPADRFFDEPDRDLFDPTAFTADEVKMIGVLGRVVGRRSVAQVGVSDQSELFEKLERPIDRRDVDATGRTTYPFGDLVRRGMTQRRHCLEHELALRGQPVAARTQLRVPGLTGLARHARSLGRVSQRSA
jgi:hypothetical protein